VNVRKSDKIEELYHHLEKRKVSIKDLQLRYCRPLSKERALKDYGITDQSVIFGVHSLGGGSPKCKCISQCNCEEKREVRYFTILKESSFLSIFNLKKRKQQNQIYYQKTKQKKFEEKIKDLPKSPKVIFLDDSSDIEEMYEIDLYDSRENVGTNDLMTKRLIELLENEDFENGVQFEEFESEEEFEDDDPSFLHEPSNQELYRDHSFSIDEKAEKEIEREEAKSQRNQVDTENIMQKRRRLEELRKLLKEEIEKHSCFPLNNFDDEISYLENHDEHPKLYKYLKNSEIKGNPNYISPMIANKLKEDFINKGSVYETLQKKLENQKDFINLLHKLVLKDVTSLFCSHTDKQQLLNDIIWTSAFPELSDIDLEQFGCTYSCFYYCYHRDREEKYHYVDKKGEGECCEICDKQIQEENKFVLFSPSDQISAILNNDNNYQKLKTNIRRIRKNRFTDFRNKQNKLEDIGTGILSQILKKLKFWTKDRISLTFTFFIDEFKAYSNSKKGKCMAIYGIINELPWDIRTKEDNLVLFGIFHSRNDPDTSAFIPFICLNQMLFFENFYLSILQKKSYETQVINIPSRSLPICVLIDKASSPWILGIKSHSGK
jgi:hypothetical protein